MIDILTTDCVGCGCKLKSKEGCTINFGKRWRSDIRLCDKCLRELSEILEKWIEENLDG